LFYPLFAALLFGQLIHHSLVSSVSLGIALRYVLEALRTGLGGKMFRFATTALHQFAGDLAQWPQYCQHLTQVCVLCVGCECASGCTAQAEVYVWQSPSHANFTFPALPANNCITFLWLCRCPA
jgi:hypothetical protein